MTTSDESSASDQSESDLPPKGPNKQKARRIVTEASDSAVWADEAQQVGSDALHSITEFIVARPLASLAAVFCLGLMLGSRKKRRR